jgi:transcription elongation GreA/GreB family factor
MENNNKIDRALLLEKVFDLLQKKLDSLNKSLRQSQDSVNQAPTAWESHSDTLRFQFERFSDNLRMLIKKTDDATQELGSIKSVPAHISLGSIVEIKKDDKILYYFISAMSLEEPISINGHECIILSKDAPIAKSLLNKKTGDDVTIETPKENYTIKIITAY